MSPKAIAILACVASFSSAAPRGCVGSVNVTSFRLSVQPGGGKSPGWIPIHHVNNLPSGYRISYQPLDLPANLGKDAKLTLVVIPKANDGQMTVLEPRLAASSTEWSSPAAARIVLVVFAPQGLDEKRLTNLVTKDENMAQALADYADQTAELEAGLQLAKELEDQDDDDSLRPARATTPAEQAIFALVKALNPSVSSYDPLGAGRKAGAATLTGKGMETFFENAGGLFPGAGALPMVKQWLMPDTEFRSVYAVQGESDGMTLCAQLGPKSRNKMAYMWAYRLINSPAPAPVIVKDANAPIGMRAGVPLKLDKAADWRLLDHVFDWTLNLEGQPPMHVTARPIVDERALRIDLRKFNGRAGSYTIQGKYDWDTLTLGGTVGLRKFDDFKAAKLTPESQDKLIAGTGPVDIDLTGCDFMFVDHATLHRPQSARQMPVDLPTDRVAAADKLRLEVDTDGLRPGTYLLALSRIDGATTDVPLQLLPPNPRLDFVGINAPRVNAGQREQKVTFVGTGLDRIEKIESNGADVTLAASSESTSRVATVRLHNTAKAGDQLVLTAKVAGVAEALRFPGALQVVGARPVILEAKPTVARDLAIAPRDGELPAGSFASFAMKIAPPEAVPVLTLQCAEAARAVQPVKLHSGEKQVGAQVFPGADGVLLLSLDPGAVGQSGCTLTATIETETLGKSDPFTLGKVVRLPRIENLSLTDEKAADGFYAILKGFDLETIDKAGWDQHPGSSAAELPRPVAGEGARQTLRVVMPWPSPSPKAPLFVWLRGESDGRATKVTP